MGVDDKLPALRPIDVTPLWTDDGEVRFALHDLARVAPRPIGISMAGYYVLAHLDGEHSCADIQAVLRGQFGLEVPAGEILKLVQALDESLMLQGERFERAYEQQRVEYLSAATRDNREWYPEGPELRREIEQMLAAGVAAQVGEVCGLIAPHLDYRRGGPCYADAYASLAKAPPAERYVILGPNHAGRSASVVGTTKDFQTPLGLARIDRDFLGRLERGLGEPLCRHEVDHRGEHSVDLQLHILQIIMDGRPFEIVPLLCPDPCGPTGTAPADGEGPDLGDFADTLAELVAKADRPTTVIAAADLSHVGQRFGDPEPTTPAFLEEVERLDRGLLSLLAAREEDAFVARITVSHNATRICSAGCIYAMLRALPRRPCRVLAYHQAVDLAAETHVTCAAAVVS